MMHPSDDHFLEVRKLLTSANVPRTKRNLTMDVLDQIMNSAFAAEYVRLMQKWLAAAPTPQLQPYEINMRDKQ